GRAVGECSYAGSEDHTSGNQLLTVLECHTKAFLMKLDRFNFSAIDIRQAFALIPLPVLNKTSKRDRCSEMISALRHIAFESQPMILVSNLCRRPIRPEVHPGRHRVFPEPHRLAKYTDLQTFDAPQAVARG